MIVNLDELSKALSKSLEGKFIINESVENDLTFPIYKTIKIELYERVNKKMEKVVVTQLTTRMPENERERCLNEAELEFLISVLKYVHTYK